MSVLGRLSAMSGELPEGLRRIADDILANPEEAAVATISQLAERTGTSPATVNRFCRALGFSGYAELRVAIATDNGRTETALWNQAIGSRVQRDDPLETMAKIIAAGDMRAIQETLDLLDLTTMEQVVTTLVDAGRIHLFGAGGSFLAADELRHRFHVIGRSVWSWSDVHHGLSAAAMMTPGDALVTFSHSGKTREAIQVQAEATGSGATTIAVTNAPRSPLAEAADLVLVTSVHEGSAFRSEALAARHSQLFLIDLVFVAVANQTHDRSLAAFDSAARAVSSQLTPPH